MKPEHEREDFKKILMDFSIYEEAGRDGYEQDLKDRAEAELMRTETQERRST